ncbi:2,3-diaminopropionate biosynthesis protein SbnB [Granulicella mallensis]|uniref:2,3-diaminopropionate biosynthesis protein SbnB n=1 Tax=Granulicella mallensis TaxID=940614 RepID=A0A7W7ZMH4_9BACT|nr:2,3-diaminopropionate biosynthesis protein SbnB [Granulicella mallensis]MBB5062618.1 2,3-diaminopropionate biosynthesis protein SbnB [Granulicella mallensis]
MGSLNNGDILLLRGKEIGVLFEGQELGLIEAVRAAYLTHEAGDTSLPNCPFLRFPHDPSARIIAKPAYLGGKQPIAGMKWVASFPGNLQRGQDRASAVLVLNSPNTGFATAILEGSLINAYRTAASAALAAQTFKAPGSVRTIGLIGAGFINFHTLRFLLTVHPEVDHIQVFDLLPSRAVQFVEGCQHLAEGRRFSISEDSGALLSTSDLVSLATTATTPYLGQLDRVKSDAVILHVSLRDFTPEAILQADNVVDDVEHVCSNQTSIHLASEQVQNRDFIRTTLGAVLAGKTPVRIPGKPLLFSPFGLGILDVAAGNVAVELARKTGHATVVHDFLPESWTVGKHAN